MIKIDRKPLQIWSCKIGECPDASVPRGADKPMRDAVADAYKRLTGHDPSFIFSGWNDELTESERAAQENRIPDPLRVTMVVHVSTFDQAREALKLALDYYRSKGTQKFNPYEVEQRLEKALAAMDRWPEVTNG